MSSNLEKMAQRAEADPFFLACPLRLYAQSEAMTDSALASALGCPPETLVPLSLCRAPAGEPTLFTKDIREIAERFGVNPDVLTEVVRRGQVILELKQPATKGSTLAAARDHEESDDNHREHGGEV